MSATTTVTLRVFLYGLLFFDVSDRCKPLHVLLLDARHPPPASDGCPIPPHRAALLYREKRMGGAYACDDPCYADHGLCRCDLEQQKLLFPQPPDAVPIVDTKKKHRCPKDLRYVVSFNDIAQSSPLRKECHNSAFEQGEGGRFITASLDLEPVDGSFVACDFESKDKRLKVFDLRPVTQEGGLYSQSIAKLFVAAQDVQLKSTKDHVVYTLRDFRGRETFDVEVPIDRCDIGRGKLGWCADVVLANLMEERPGAGRFGRCNEPDVARHFEVVHDLFAAPIRLEDRAVPHARPHLGAKVPAPPALCKSDVAQIFSDLLVRTGTHAQICPSGMQ